MTKKPVEKDKKTEKLEAYINKEIFVYVGETVANHRINITKNSIIKDLKSYKDLFKEIPGLEKLFIKIANYPEVKMRMKEPTSSINRRIKEVGKIMREVTNV